MTNATPELRAQIIAGILQHVAETPATVSYDAVFRRALAATKLPEEEIGEEIKDATSCLIFANTLLSNGFVREAGEIRYSANMELVLGPWLLGFVHGDRVLRHEGGEA
ncbi:hypothetical protein [Bosea sp. PAMC 26642]|uniref:hypothetical protein n=1 Tax=Bosea sp. (strain PAMC 26642) TaxID=1792307 RepID=UPI00076FE84B|nr:hypothetical protein [Bosea sp. PAMC 26642]AMJ61972.1 hypothetical protein AXW83_18200 [Bosea sp. PAMC 26642]